MKRGPFKHEARKLEVLQSLANGKIYKQIADDCSTSADTIKETVGKLRRQFAVATTAELVATAIRKGIIV